MAILDLPEERGVMGQQHTVRVEAGYSKHSDWSGEDQIQQANLSDIVTVRAAREAHLNPNRVRIESHTKLTKGFDMGVNKLGDPIPLPISQLHVDPSHALVTSSNSR